MVRVEIDSSVRGMECEMFPALVSKRPEARVGVVTTDTEPDPERDKSTES